MREPEGFILVTGFGPPAGGEAKGTKNGLDHGSRVIGDANFITPWVGECRMKVKFDRLSFIVVSRASSGLGLIPFIRGSTPESLTAWPVAWIVYKN